MKVTKTPKKVKLFRIPLIINSEKILYTCPCCKIQFELHGMLGKNITRFKCDCGQELIVT